MSSAHAIRVPFVAFLLLAAASPVLAQEASEPPAEDAVRTFIAPVTVHTGYQASSHDSLEGIETALVLGFRIAPADRPFQQFFEVGITRLANDDSPVVTSGVLIGGRMAWRWDRLAVHFMARLHHGDAATGDDSVAIYSPSTSFGLMTTFDLFRRRSHSIALGLHGIGRLYEAADGDDVTVAFGGGGGLSLVVW